MGLKLSHVNKYKSTSEYIGIEHYAINAKQQTGTVTMGIYTNEAAKTAGGVQTSEFTIGIESSEHYGDGGRLERLKYVDFITDKAPDFSIFYAKIKVNKVLTTDNAELDLSKATDVL